MVYASLVKDYRVLLKEVPVKDRGLGRDHYDFRNFDAKPLTAILSRPTQIYQPTRRMCRGNISTQLVRQVIPYIHERVRGASAFLPFLLKGWLAALTG
jgi:hypothetical protein